MGWRTRKSGTLKQIGTKFPVNSKEKYVGRDIQIKKIVREDDNFLNGMAICAVLSLKGHEAFIVGGSVRDILMNVSGGDVDITTDATPSEVKSIFDGNVGYKVFPVGEKFGTVLICRKEMEPIEVTTYRSEGKYSDSRHPDEVKFEKDIIKDLSRRDFTINAIAYDPIKNAFIDPYNGADDIEKRIVRAVGNSDERFTEDPLRMMRMARFAGKFNFRVDKETLDSARRNHEELKKLPYERVRDELFKILNGDNASRALGILTNTKIMEEFLPEVSVLEGKRQPEEYHKYSVFDHTMKTVDFIPKDKPLLRFAGLVHDIGKLKKREDKPYYPDHEQVSVSLLDKIFDRLRFSNKDKEYVRFMVSRHMDGKRWKDITERSVRRYLGKFGNVNLMPDLLTLIRADIRATGYANKDSLSRIDKFENYVNEVVRRKRPLTRKDLAINGSDIIKLGVPPSRKVGEIQETLLEEVISNPENNTRNHLLERAKELSKIS